MIVVALSVLVLLSGCGVQRVDIEKEKEELLNTDRAFAAASLETNAAEAFRMYLAEDAMQMPTGSEPIIGREYIFESMNRSAQNYTLSWNPERAEVSKAGDMGWTWGWYLMSYTDANGEPKQSRGKYLNIWKKMPDGSWKVAVDMGN
jgi:ketosteroid isomerase-like protein